MVVGCGAFTLFEETTPESIVDIAAGWVPGAIFSSTPLTCWRALTTADGWALGAVAEG